VRNSLGKTLKGILTVRCLGGRRAVEVVGQRRGLCTCSKAVISFSGNVGGLPWMTRIVTISQSTDHAPPAAAAHASMMPGPLPSLRDNMI
jgi:hypothetical protein